MFPRASVNHVLGQIRQASGGTRHEETTRQPAAIRQLIRNVCRRAD